MATDFNDLAKYLNNPNVRNFLNYIAESEGTGQGPNSYNIGFNYQPLSPTNNERSRTFIKPTAFKNTDGKTQKTTATGRYQFLKGTWDDITNRYKFPDKDLTNKNQDIGAIALMHQKGALNDVLAGNYGKAINKLGSVWASLPSSNYKQKKNSWKQAESFFNQPMGDYSKKLSSELNTTRDKGKSNSFMDSFANNKETNIAFNELTNTYVVPKNDSEANLITAVNDLGIPDKNKDKLLQAVSLATQLVDVKNFDLEPGSSSLNKLFSLLMV